MMLSIWKKYLSTLPDGHGLPPEPPSVWHFGDNEHDADELAELARRGIKRATSPSLWYFESTGEPLPQAGELHVVTNWAGEPRCIIRTTRVEVVSLDRITAEYAETEGEGDGSLDYWKRVHWDYYRRELADTGKEPTDDMPIVCEYFEVVFPLED